MTARSEDEERAIRDRVVALAGETLGRPVLGIEPIEAGLGQRRFYRLQLAAGPPETVVARVEAPEDPALRPPGLPPEPPLEPIRSLLERRGLPVPVCYACTPETMLLEDAGRESLETAARHRPADEVRALYAEACAWIPRLQAVSPADDLPRFDRRLGEAFFTYKAEQVVEWVLPWALGRAGTPAEAEVVRDAFALVARESRQAPQRLSHRDYKAANLHLRPGGEPGRRLVMIDLQGALLAPPEYDLVCLLRDSHVALDERFVRSRLEETRQALPDRPSPEVFARRFALLTLTRNGKDLARYLYAAHTRGDTRYLALLPRAARTLRAAAREAAPWDARLERLQRLFESLPESPCAP